MPQCSMGAIAQKSQLAGAVTTCHDHGGCAEKTRGIGELAHAQVGTLGGRGSVTRRVRRSGHSASTHVCAYRKRQSHAAQVSPQKG